MSRRVEISPYGMENEHYYLTVGGWLRSVGRVLCGLVFGRRVGW